MKTQIEIEMPSSWEDLTFRTYIEIKKDLEAYVDDEEAQTAFLIHNLCGLAVEEIQALSAQSYNILRTKLIQFMNNENHKLVPIVKVDGILYGFEPNLSKMSYGAYADISKYKSLEMNEDWLKIMSILYRPVTERKGTNYSIEAYTGYIDGDEWRDVPMNIHFGALFFLSNLFKDLLSSTLNSMNQLKVMDNYKKTLEKNGELMQQLLKSPTVTSGILMR
jgi:hypothetical protein